MKSSGPRSQNGIPRVNYPPTSCHVATWLFVADILYNLNRCARTRDNPDPRRDMSAYANGIAIRRGLSLADAKAPLFNRRGGPDSTVIEHVQPFSSGRPPPPPSSPPVPLPRHTYARIRDGLTKVPKINIPNVGSDGFITVKGVQIACEFWRKNYRGMILCHVVVRSMRVGRRKRCGRTAEI